MSRIVTFYSYKGGVGRTFALANIAVLLAKRNKKILIMDWDLEAPGLDRFFRPYIQPARPDQGGLIHLLSSVIKDSVHDWRSYLSEIQIEGCAPISIVRSGDAAPDYVSAVQSFSWPDFFENHEGGATLDQWRDEWKSTYDFVLIDSRTGITDVGGVCTIFLPDVLVLGFTANDQSFGGALEVAQAVQRSRRELAVTRPPLAVLPLPGRFDARDEVDTANAWLGRFSTDLKLFYDDWLPKQFKPLDILELTKVPYLTKLSFGEPLAVLQYSLTDPEFPGFYLNNVARLIASDFSDANEILAPRTGGTNQSERTITKLKELLPRPTERVALHDMITGLLRRAADGLDQRHFSTDGQLTNDEFTARIARYDETISELATAVVLLSRWASTDQQYLLDAIFERTAEFEKPGAGLVVWLRLYWYPVLVLMYAAGIAALAGRNYRSLRSALLTPVHARVPLTPQEKPPVVLPTITELTGAAEEFKRLPAMGQKYTPRSEHLYALLQPIFQEQLFLGRKYEELFDEFEMILALTFADLRDDDPRRHVWGPPGRFVWKERGRFDNYPVFSRFVDHAKSMGQKWEPLQYGFFRGSAERFAIVADAYKQLISQVNRW